MNPAIEVSRLTKKFGRVEVLHGISFTVEPGTVFGVIGPNGAGKTTTMRCLLDIIRPTSGTARMLGTDPAAGGPGLRRRIGYLPGELILEARTTGRRLLHHYAEISGPVKPGRIDELAGRLRIDLDQQIRRLSKGNKQKLGLIQAFMHDPELLVLDEPTSGLDPLLQQEFIRMVREARRQGQTVFLSSHVLSEIQQAADEVAILRDGGIVTIATVDELRETAVRHLRLTAVGLGAPELHEFLGRIPGIGSITLNGAAGADPAAVEASATLEGDVQPLVEALAGIRLKDLVIEEPDLEEAVLKLYAAPEREAVQ